MNTKKITTLAIIVLPFISGCFDGERTIYAICDDNPAICSDIETQGWCKAERSQVIRHRERQLIKPEDQLNLYSSLKHWQKFSRCIEIAANIKRRATHDRNSVKETTFLNTLYAIEKIEKDTINSELPLFMYYHWSQNGDRTKIKQLISLDDQGKLNTSELQQLMALYYNKTNRSKAIAAQYNALKFLTENDLAQLDPSLFASFATHYYQDKNFKASYIWAKIAVMFGLKANKYTALTRELRDRRVNLTKLDQIAEKTYNSIQSLQFTSPIPLI